MRKVLLTCASMMATFALIGPASAAAQSPELVVCLGAGQSDGSFTPQELNTGQLPGIGLALGQTACLNLNPDAGAAWAENFADGLSNAEPPSEPPTQEDIEAIADAIANADPSNPLAVLLLANTICQRTGMTDYCGALLGGALSAPIPLGGSANLDGDSGSCFGGTQSGTGTWSGGGSFYNLEWTADYEQGANVLGVMSGTATPRFGGGESREVTGIYGPGCGAGVKALVLVIN